MTSAIADVAAARSTSARLAVDVALAGLTAVLAIAFLPDHLVADDTYIYLRYAENLAAGRGLCFSPGDTVHGCTSVAYCWVLAALRWLTGADLLALAVVVHVASAVWFGHSLRRLLSPGPFAAIGWLGAAFFVTRPIMALCVGMDGVLFVATATAAFVAGRRSGAVTFGALLAAACLVRPEALALVLVTVADRAWRERAVPWRAIFVAAAPVLAWCAFATWRFGSPLPVSAAAKVLHAQSGLWPAFGSRILDWIVLGELGGAWLAAWLLAALALLRSPRGAFVALVAWMLLHNGTLALLGVPCYPWYYFPLLAQVAITLVLGADRLLAAATAKVPPQRSWWIASASVAATLAAAAWWSPAAAARGTLWPRDLRPVEDRYFAIASWLRQHAPPDASLATLEIGILGYWSGLRIDDLCGLVTPVVAEHIPSRRHVRFVVESRQPTFLLGHVPNGAMETGLPELAHRHYRLVRSVDDCELWQRLAPAAVLTERLVAALPATSGEIAIADPWPSLDREGVAAALAGCGWRLVDAAAASGGASFARLQPDDRWQLVPATALAPVIYEGAALDVFAPHNATRVPAARELESGGATTAFVATGPGPFLAGELLLPGPVVAIRVVGHLQVDGTPPEDAAASLLVMTGARPHPDLRQLLRVPAPRSSGPFVVEFRLPPLRVPADETLSRIFVSPLDAQCAFRVERIEILRR